MTKIRLFQPSLLSTDCDACGGRVDQIQGGVCVECARILCYRHLYGSWLVRLRAEFGARTRCVDCRAGRRPAAPGVASPPRA